MSYLAKVSLKDSITKKASSNDIHGRLTSQNSLRRTLMLVPSMPESEPSAQVCQKVNLPINRGTIELHEYNYVRWEHKHCIPP